MTHMTLRILFGVGTRLVIVLEMPLTLRVCTRPHGVCRAGLVGIIVYVAVHVHSYSSRLIQIESWDSTVRTLLQLSEILKVIEIRNSIRSGLEIWVILHSREILNLIQANDSFRVVA